MEKAETKEGLDGPPPIDAVAIEVGLGLVHLVEAGPQSALLRRIGVIRKQLATDLGFTLPAVRIADNLSLKASEYVISLRACPVERFELQPGCVLILQPGAAAAPPAGAKPTREPAFGIDAWWIPLWELDEFSLVRRNISGLPEKLVNPYQDVERWVVQSWYPTENP